MIKKIHIFVPPPQKNRLKTFAVSQTLRHIISTNLHIFHDKVLFRLEIKDLLQLDNVRVGDGAEDRDLALDHVLLALTLRLEVK